MKVLQRDEGEGVDETAGDEFGVGVYLHVGIGEEFVFDETR
jgi:hypothetical protein